MRDEASTTIRLANVTSEDTTRQARKRSLAIPVIYDSITRAPKKQRDKKVKQFDHLRSNDKENYSTNMQDYMWLVKTRHREDEDMLVYEVTNVYVLRSAGDIVGSRAIVMKDGSLFTKEERGRSSYIAIVLLSVGKMSQTRQ